MSKEYDVAAISKTVRIIDYIKEKGASYFKDIHQDLGLAKSTTYQILSTCVKYNLLTINSNRKYELGIKLLEWGYTMKNGIDIRSVAHNILSRLAKDLQVSVHLGILLDNRMATFIEKYDGPLYTIKSTVVGQKILFNCQSTGKVLLAWEDDEIQEEIFEEIDFMPFTPTTIINKEELRIELRKVKENGYAFDNHERTENLYGIGVPVFNWDGKVVAAISLGILAFEIQNDQILYYVEKLRESSENITELLG